MPRLLTSASTQREVPMSDQRMNSQLENEIILNINNEPQRTHNSQIQILKSIQLIRLRNITELFQDERANAECKIMNVITKRHAKQHYESIEF